MRHLQKCLFHLPERDLQEIVVGVGDDWIRLRGARIFVSGGTGFFGKWILGALAFADAELGLNLRLTILSRAPERFLEIHPKARDRAGWNWIEGDVATFSGGNERFDFVLHAATDTLGVATPAAEERRAHAIVEGTRRMLELTRSSVARRMLNVSSGAVYGAAAGQLAGAREEDFAGAFPLTPYARAKREAEQLCEKSGVDFVTARAFAFLGPHLSLDAHYAAGNFLRDAHRGGPIIVRGDGTALRAYLYPTDLVIWLLRILLHGEPARAYNVGSDEAISTGDLARRSAQACSPALDVVIEAALPHGPQNIYLGDISRARRELGLAVTVPLDDAIRRTLAWL